MEQLTLTVPWADYKAGFGNPDGEFWLGLDKLYTTTTSCDYSLRVDMEDWTGVKYWAWYSHFSVGPESDEYRLSISGYYPGSTAGDSITNPSYPDQFLDGMKFSTYDRDQDGHPGGHCADSWKGGYWYEKCHVSNPTGLYLLNGVSNAQGVVWHTAYSSSYSFKVMRYTLIPK